jgi:plasmid maintenance system antidote protein VapI
MTAWRLQLQQAWSGSSRRTYVVPAKAGVCASQVRALDAQEYAHTHGKCATENVKASPLRMFKAVNMRAVAPSAPKNRVRDLTPEQAELVRKALREWVDKCSGKRSGLAALMGVDQSGFGRFLDGKQGTSWAVALRAAALMGVSVNELLEIRAEDLRFPSMKDDPIAEAAARLALLDGVPRAQIESRYRDAMKGLAGMRVNDWHQKLTGGVDPEKLAPAKPKLKPSRRATLEFAEGSKGSGEAFGEPSSPENDEDRGHDSSPTSVGGRTGKRAR